MPIAPPPGTVFDTAVLDWVTTAACGTVRPGMVATIRNQYVARFHTAATPRMVSWSQVIDWIDAQTAEMLVNLGRKYQKTAMTISTDSAGASSWRGRSRRRPRAAGAASPASV